MWLHVEHTTDFRYGDAIAEAYSELRVKPLSAGGQRCSSFRLTIEPSVARTHEYVDQFGNDVIHFNVLEPHDRLAVTATSDVYTPGGLDDEARPLTPTEQHDYLAPTALASSGGPAELAAAANRAAPERLPWELMELVRSELAYEPGATDVHTTADDALRLGRGVCQDFAHVLIAACRSRALPARYVSGYLHSAELDGETAASHAWVDVWTDGRWTALDPTHGREQNEHYVRVAVGRDYADVPPTRGVYKGAAQETLEVRVVVRTV
jgi:transglutaminase-like putative cysteine protease